MRCISYHKLLRVAPVFLFILFVGVARGQCSECPDTSEKGLLIGVSTGIGAGWWIFRRGASNTGPAWDRSDFSFSIPISVELLYRFSWGKMGLGYGRNWLLEDEMELFEDTFPVERVYKIADKAVTFKPVYIHLEPYLIKKSKFALSPSLKWGVFGIDTLHPDRDNFGRKHFWELGLNYEIHLSKLDVLFTPRYRTMVMHSKVERQPGERHFIFGIELAVGLRLAIM